MKNYNRGVSDCLWEVYCETKDLIFRNIIVEKYLYLAEVLANKMFITLDKQAEYNDLYSYACVGLIDAVEKFKLTFGYTFSTYASIRINGAMIDGLRKDDWIPRSTRSKVKKFYVTLSELQNRHGAQIDERELAKSLNLSIREQQLIFNEADNTVNLSELDYCISDKKYSFDPYEIVVAEDISKIVKNLLDDLSDIEKNILVLKYYNGNTSKDISKEINIPISKVDRVKYRAIKKLRKIAGDRADLKMAIA